MLLRFMYEINTVAVQQQHTIMLVDAKKSPENSGLFGIFHHGKTQYSGTKKRTIKLQAVTVLTRL